MDRIPQTESTARGPWRGRAFTIAFWLALAVTSVAIVAPLWVGPISSTVDFGGHLQVVDAWARYDDAPLLRRYLVRRKVWLQPNLLNAHFVALLYPWLSPNDGLRLYTSLSVWAIIASLLFVLSVFDRSRWQIFLCIPFLWGGALTLGTVNYLLGIAAVFFALGTARLAGIHGKRRHAFALGAIGLATFFIHAFGYMLMFATAIGVLVLSAKRWRNLWCAVGLLPSALLTGYWTAESFEKGVLGQWTDLQLPFSEQFRWVINSWFNVTTSIWDSVLMGVMVWVWGLLLVMQRQDRPPAAELPEPPPASETPSKRAELIARLRALGFRHTLLLVALGCAVGAFVLPAEMIDTIYIRFVNPLGLSLMLVPRANLARPLSRRALAIAFVVALAFGLHVTSWTRGFSQMAIEPLVGLLHKLPRGKRCRCVGVMTYMPFARFADFRPLATACNGLIQIQRGGFSGGGWAFDKYNAVVWRTDLRGVLPHPVIWLKDPAFAWWDYIIERSPSARNDPRVKLVGHARFVDDINSWWLYKIKDPLK